MPGIALTQAVEANEVFVTLPREIIPKLQDHWQFHVGTKRPRKRVHHAFDTRNPTSGFGDGAGDDRLEGEGRYLTQNEKGKLPAAADALLSAARERQRLSLYAGSRKPSAISGQPVVFIDCFALSVRTAILPPATTRSVAPEFQPSVFTLRS